jgi:hypothetical protein
MSLKKNIQRQAIALISKKVNKRYVIIESDDWGSIRMPSNEAFETLIKKGVPIGNDPFNRYDSLESEEDLALLFETLSSIKDCNGKNPIITANTIVANPDFEKIKNANFEKYYYESVVDTFKKYPNHSNSLKMWKEGIDNNLFYPQFHGREHLDINTWLDLLKSKDKDFLLAFDLGVFGINKKIKIHRRYDCMATFDINSEKDKNNHPAIIKEGMDIFKSIFGYSSKSFIAPTYVWDENLENILAENSVKYLQGFNYQLIPRANTSNYIKKIHYTGQKNKLDQTYLVRNAFFEPSLYKKDWENEVLNRAKIAFRWNTPLIISSHRVNFIGELDKSNRDNNLKLLSKTLKTLLKKWPNIEFIHSSKLGDILNGEK